jgi:hypothetical protein
MWVSCPASSDSPVRIVVTICESCSEDCGGGGTECVGGGIDVEKASVGGDDERVDPSS